MTQADYIKMGNTQNEVMEDEINEKGTQGKNCC